MLSTSVKERAGWGCDQWGQGNSERYVQETVAAMVSRVYVVVAVVSMCMLLLMGCCFVFSVSLKVGVGFSPMVGYTHPCCLTRVPRCLREKEMVRR